MSNSPFHVLLLATLCLSWAACGEDPADPPADESFDAGADAEDAQGDGEDAPEVPTCGGSAWSPGEPVYREVTQEWGLDALGTVTGRMSVADIDGDGWPDLILRRVGNGGDDFGPEGRRYSWLLRNTGQKSFEDVTQSSGWRQWRQEPPAPGLGRPGEVIAAADVDNDGDLDLYMGHNTTTDDAPEGVTSELMLNQGDGTFTLGPEDSDLRRQEDVPTGATFVDVNRDGFIDLWVSQAVPANQNEGLQDRLYLGDGQGGFRDVTRQAGLSTYEWRPANLNGAVGHSFAWSSTACDLNNDGAPELMAASYGRLPNHLWRAEVVDREPGVYFTNHSIQSGYAYDERMDWSDNESARCWCTLHPDDVGCEGVPEPALIRCSQDADAFRWRHSSDRELYRLGGNSGTTVCADLNNDGFMDLLTSEIVHWDVGTSSDPSEILLNQGAQDVRLQRPGNDATGLTRPREGLTWDHGDITAAVFDMDNDGWQDIYIASSDYPGTRGWLYHQRAPMQFEAVPIEDGVDQRRSSGVLHVDLDRDGDLDLVLGHSRNRCGDATDCYDTAQVRIFENTLGQRNAWIQLRLEGAQGTNRAAIGARVQAIAGELTQTREVDGGHGHYGTQQDTLLHFGLGQACQAQLTVRWPDAALTTETATLEAGKRYLWRQGQAPEPID